MRASILPPDQWTADQLSTSCEQCSKAFTLSRRRHHCRVCGGLFCSGCAPPGSLSVPDPARGAGATQRVRACVSCVIHATAPPPPPPKQVQALQLPAPGAVMAGETAGEREAVGRTDTPRPVVSAGEALLGGTVEDPEHIRLETRARLRRIFSAHNTRKLGDIEVLMEEWKGREDVLLQKVEAKYADQSSLPSPEELELGSGAHQQ